MKKLTSQILALLIVASILTLSACNGTPSASQKEPTVKAITLTVNNLNEYFSISGYSDNYSESTKDYFGWTKYNCSCTMHISIEKTRDFEIKEPIEIKFLIDSLYSWGSISGTKSENDQTYVTISIPASGNINKTYQCSSTAHIYSMVNSLPQPYPVEVIGTIYVTE